LKDCIKCFKSNQNMWSTHLLNQKKNLKKIHFIVNVLKKDGFLRNNFARGWELSILTMRTRWLWLIGWVLRRDSQMWLEIVIGIFWWWTRKCMKLINLWSFTSGGFYKESNVLDREDNHVTFDPTQLGLPLSFKSNSFDRN